MSKMLPLYKCVSKKSIAFPLWCKYDNQCEYDNQKTEISIAKHGRISEKISLQQLWFKSCRWAKYLEVNSSTRSKVLISLENGVSFIEVFFGCILSGRIPIPLVYHPMLPTSEFKKLIANIQDSNLKPELFISDTLSTFLPGRPSIHVDQTILPLFSKHWSFPHQSKGEDIALIQFSSGSTSAPKGIMLTHNAIIENITQILNALKVQKNDKLCTWLPFYHDMGLIGGLLAPLTGQNPIILSTPSDFIRFPHSWLEVVGRERGTILLGPDFYYRHLVKSIPKDLVPEFDLSHIRLALSGAEFVNAMNSTNFIKHFATAGLRDNVMLPVYGLAENCLAVSFPPIERPFRSLKLDSRALQNNQIIPTTTNKRFMEVVSCGRPLPNIEVFIANSTGEFLGENEIGEIVIRSPSLFKGYEGSSGSQKMLFTGDLGFLNDGELFIVGRIKDQIIINGKNIDPLGLELSVAKTKDPLIGRVAAIGLQQKDGSGEKVAMAAEVRTLNPFLKYRIKNNIRKILYSSHFITPLVFLVPPGMLPRTTSGKVKRYQIKKQAERGLLQTYDRWFIPFKLVTTIKSMVSILRFQHGHNKNKSAKRNIRVNLEHYLKKELSEILGTHPSRIHLKAPFVRYNLDSLSVLELNIRLKEHISDIPLPIFIGFQTVEELIQHLITNCMPEVRSWNAKNS